MNVKSRLHYAFLIRLMSSSNLNKSVYVPSASKKRQAPDVPMSERGNTSQPLCNNLIAKTSPSNMTYTRSPMQVMPSSVSTSSSIHDNNTVKNVYQSCSDSNSAGFSKKDVNDLRVDNKILKKSVELKPMTEMIIQDGYISLRPSLKSNPGNQADSVTENVQAISILKPIVSDVKLLPHGAVLPKQFKLCISKSTDAIDYIELLNNTADDDKVIQTISPRSSFMDPNGPPTHCSVYIELGEYQTLLKHSGNNKECIYSLPQPLCYGENTLKSIKLITEKYDTFKRRQLRASSFCTVNTSEVDDASLLGTSSCSPHRNINLDSTITEEEALDLVNNCFSIDDSNLVKTSIMNIDGAVTVDQLGAAVKTEKNEELQSALLRTYCNAPVDIKQNCDVSQLKLLDRLKIEMFYRSRGTCVYVCCSLADVFIGTYSGNDFVSHWIHIHTGVPVWLLNSGTAVRSRSLILVIADRETGFPLWRDSINYLSNYHELSLSTHALRVSGSLSKSIKLNIFDNNAADEFLDRYRCTVVDPNDVIWKISKENEAIEKDKTSCLNLKKKQYKKLKSSISQPCNFVHVSHVDLREVNFRSAFADLLPLTGSGDSRLKTQSDLLSCTTRNQLNEFRLRLPTS